MSHLNLGSSLDALTIEDFKKIITALHGLSECPVCREILKSPIAQCTNGHAVCADCKQRITRCPTCSSKLVVESSTLIKQMLEVIPKPCKYHLEGCESLALADHEVCCAYKTMECISCSWIGRVGSLKSHMEADHPFTRKQFEWFFSYAPEPRKSLNTSAIVYKFDEPFVVQIQHDHKQFAVGYKIAHIPLKEPLCIYIAVCKLDCDSVKFAETVNIPVFPGTIEFKDTHFSYMAPREKNYFLEGDMICFQIQVLEAKTKLNIQTV